MINRYLINLHLLMSTVMSGGRRSVRARGMGALEYALMAAGIALLIFTVFKPAMTDLLGNLFGKVKDTANRE